MIYVSVDCQHQNHQHCTALGKDAHLGCESGKCIHDLRARKGYLIYKCALWLELSVYLQRLLSRQPNERSERACSFSAGRTDFGIPISSSIKGEKQAWTSSRVIHCSLVIRLHDNG